MIIGSGSLLVFLIAAMIVFPQFRVWVIVLAFPILFWLLAGPVGCVLLAIALLLWFIISQVYGIPFGGTPEKVEKYLRRAELRKKRAKKHEPEPYHVTPQTFVTEYLDSSKH